MAHAASRSERGGMGIEISTPEVTESLPPPPDVTRDPYRGVIIVLLAAALVGFVSAVTGGFVLASSAVLAAAVTLGLASGVLAGVAAAQTARARPPKLAQQELQRHEETSKRPTSLLDRIAVLLRGEPGSPTAAPDAGAPSTSETPALRQELSLVGTIRISTAMLGAVAIWLLVFGNFPEALLAPLPAAIAAVLTLVGAALAATATRYLAAIDPAQLPEAPGLCRGARLTAWVLALTAIAIGFSWMDQQTIRRILFFAVLAINAAVCYGLFTSRPSKSDAGETFPLDLGVLSILGNRANILASVLDSAERQLGIDLRSTWALTVVRLTVEPLIISLCLLGWLSTSLTVVGIEEQGLVERLGVPLGGQPLQPGLHLHWPWPVDQVFRIPMQRVQALTVGHEGEEEGGPENVLWAVEHAANEYTLLLGNGRDLITVDAAVQYRIVDAPAWRYHCQNPADALKAMAYRAVMRSTVNRTLSDALSENVTTLTARMRAMVQQEADALGLGVEVLAFTVGGMHPPVPVASDYQAVVSAEFGKVTAVVNAQTFRNRTIPDAEASVVAGRTGRARGRRRSPRPGRGRGVGVFERWNPSIAPRPRNSSSGADWKR